MNLALAESGEWMGAIVDVGGTSVPLPSYRAFFQLAADARVTTVNIDADARPDIVADAAQVPVEDATFDGAWCLNLLEHVENPAAVVHEMARVLKPGSHVACFTPFLVRVHGHPQDYHRFTDTALHRLFESAGFQIEQIRAAGGGPFLAAVAQIQPVLPRVLFVPFTLLALGLDRIIYRLRPALATAWPLGFLLLERKR
jgi:SAM-dependent methyltransferase